MAKSPQPREWWFRCLCSCLWQVEKMFEFSHVFLMSSAGMLCSSWGKHCLPGMCSLHCVLATCSCYSPRPLSSALRAFDFLGIWWAYLWLCCNKQTSPKLDLSGLLTLFVSLFCPCWCGPLHHLAVHGVSWGNTYVLIRPHRISCFSDSHEETDRTPNQRNTGQEDILTRGLRVQPSWLEDMVAGMWGRCWCLQSAREWQMWGMLMLPPEYGVTSQFRVGFPTSVNLV